MSVKAVTHLNFSGNARQALEFYHSVFGGNLMIATYADFGAPKDAPNADQVVFGQVTAENGFSLMAYDIPSGEPATSTDQPSTYREHGMTITQEPFFISLRGDNTDEITGFWDKLSDDAHMIEPIAQAQWALLFGMLTDRFGVTWVVDVVPPYNPF